VISLRIILNKEVTYQNNQGSRFSVMSGASQTCQPENPHIIFRGSFSFNQKLRVHFSTLKMFVCNHPALHANCFRSVVQECNAHTLVNDLIRSTPATCSRLINLLVKFVSFLMTILIVRLSLRSTHIQTDRDIITPKSPVY
jgi:hypothetical protein